MCVCACSICSSRHHAVVDCTLGLRADVTRILALNMQMLAGVSYLSGEIGCVVRACELVSSNKLAARSRWQGRCYTHFFVSSFVVTAGLVYSVYAGCHLSLLLGRWYQ